MAIGLYVRARFRAGHAGFTGTDGTQGEVAPSFGPSEPWRPFTPSNGVPVPFVPVRCQHEATICPECAPEWDVDYELNLESRNGPQVRDAVLAARATAQ